MPADSDGQGLHFQIYPDTTDASTLAADSANSTERGLFEWQKEPSWVAIPADGVTAGTANHTPAADLATDDDHFYIIRAWDGTANGASSATQRFIVADRNWTDITAAGNSIRVIHLTELREEANRRNAYSLTDVAWTDPTITANITPIRATHFTELRTGLTDVRDRTDTAVIIGAEVNYKWTAHPWQSFPELALL